MRYFRWALLIVCLAIGLPALAIVILYYLPADWRNVLKDFQAFIGGAVALGAAVIAFINVSMQVRSAESGVNAQIQANRENEQDRRKFVRDQLKGALAGELLAFSRQAKNRNIVGYYHDNAEHVRGAGRFVFWSIGLSRPHKSVFVSNAAGIGSLEDDLPMEVITAYSDIDALFDRLDASERGHYNNLIGDAATKMVLNISREADTAINKADEVAAKLLKARNLSTPPRLDPVDETDMSQSATEPSKIYSHSQERGP